MVSWGSCQYVYHLVEVTLPDGSGPVQLVHMKLKKGTTTLAHLPLKEVYDKLVAPSFSYSYFYHKLKRIAGKPPATVQGDDRAMILRFGVSSEYANKIAVLPIGLAITTLRLLGGQPAAKVPILTAIKRQTAHMHILPLPQHMMQANPLSQAAPPQLQLARWPATMSHPPYRSALWLVFHQTSASKQLPLGATDPATERLQHEDLLRPEAHHQAVYQDLGQHQAKHFTLPWILPPLPKCC